MLGLVRYSKNPTSALQVARINKQQHRLRRARYTRFRGLSTKLQALALLWPGDPLVLIPLGSTGTKQAPGAARLITARAGRALLKITARYLK